MNFFRDTVRGCRAYPPYISRPSVDTVDTTNREDGAVKRLIHTYVEHT